MNKIVSEKLLTIALAGIRYICEQKDLSFSELVAKSMDDANDEMTLELIEQAIAAFDETGDQDGPEDFLKYLEGNSSKGGGLS